MNRPKPEPPGIFRFPSLLYLLVSLLAFFPCLFLGLAYFDNDLLAQFGPWRIFLRDRLAQGDFPLWNPYLLGGQPFFADLQNMMLYPLNYLTLPFPVAYGFGVFFFLHLLLALLGAHRWLSSLELSPRACAAGALVFGLSNFFWWEIIHLPVLAAFAWMPWLFFGLEKLARDPKPRTAFWTGLAFAMLFLCGSLQMTLGAFYGGLAYFFVRAFPLLRKAKGTKGWRPFLLGALFLLWGALPLLGQFIPTLEFAKLSERYKTAPSKTETHLSLDPATLGQFLFPKFTLEPGRTIGNAVQETNKNRFLANLGYLGVWVPFLFGAAFFHKDRKLALLMASLGGVALLICLGNYLGLERLLASFLPGMAVIQVPFRYLYLYVLAASVLAAMGFEALTDRPSAFVKAGAAYAFLLGTVALFNPGRTWIEILGLVLGAAALALFDLKATGFKKAAPLLFIGALAVPLFLTGWTNFIPGPAANFDYSKNSGALGEIARKASPFRVILHFLKINYPVQVNGQTYLTYYPQDACNALPFKNFGGYNPLTLRSTALLRTLPVTALVRMGGIRAFISGANHGEIPGFKLHSEPPLFWNEYQGPLSYVFAPPDIVVPPDEARMEGILKRPDFDPYRQALLSSPPTIPGLSGRPIRLHYEILLDEPDRQSFKLDLDRDGCAVFCEVMYPGWKASVDGKPSALVTADSLLRALYVPAGSHQVEFRFEPDWAKPLAGGLALWLLLTTVWSWKNRRA